MTEDKPKIVFFDRMGYRINYPLCAGGGRMTDQRMTPEEAWKVIELTLNCTEHTHCATEREIMVTRFFNYSRIEQVAKKVVECWQSGNLAAAIRELDEVIKNPSTGYKHD